jgi:hypothetical protein
MKIAFNAGGGPSSAIPFHGKRKLLLGRANLAANRI